MAQARATLDGLLAASHDSRTVYLAHLFLADLASRRKEPGEAVHEYTAAIAAAPAFSVPYIGLSNMMMRTGDRPRAREYISKWVARSGSGGHDPWDEYRSGQDLLSLTVEHLVAIVSQ